MQYETPSDDVRQLFEEHGEIKTFFDLIANRGMVFVTYVSRKIVMRSTFVHELHSMTFVQRREPVRDYRVQKSVAVL